MDQQELQRCIWGRQAVDMHGDVTPVEPLFLWLLARQLERCRELLLVFAPVRDVGVASHFSPFHSLHDGRLHELAQGALRTRTVPLTTGITLEYVLEGPSDAPVVAFVHGLGANLHPFAAQAERFRDRYRVLLLSLRGHGGTSNPEQPLAEDDEPGRLRSLTIFGTTAELRSGRFT